MTSFRFVTPGCSIRLTKTRSTALLGARITAFRECRSLYPASMIEEDILRPNIVYLYVQDIQTNTLFCDDLRTFKFRIFEQERVGIHTTGKFKERTVGQDNKPLFDAWCWEQLRIISPHDAVKVIEESQRRLDECAETAKSAAKRYEANSHAVLLQSRIAAAEAQSRTA